MKIIGHRGAAGIELENSKSGLIRAVNLGVDAIEFDVRLTKDDELVLCHDASLERIAGLDIEIRQHDWSELSETKLVDGSRLLKLTEALEILGTRPAIIEVKSRGSAGPLRRVLDKFPAANVSIASFRLEELADIKRLIPTARLYGLSQAHPFDIIHAAKQFKFSGIGLKFWLLNPLTYWLARRSGLELYVYTVNHRGLAWFIRLLYPRAGICTDYPNRFLVA